MTDATVLQHFVPLLTFATLTATRPPHPLRLGGALLVTYLYYKLAADSAVGESLLDYSQGCCSGFMVATIPVLLWFQQPMRDKFRGENALPETYPLYKRVYYALCVINSPRLIGWTSQISSVPPPYTKGKRDFLKTRILSVLLCLFYLDFTQTYITVQPTFPLRGTPDFPKGFKGYIMYTCCTYAFYLSVYANTKLRYNLISIICVATGLVNGDPELWPDTFGKWSDAYTLRHFWGKTWHQMLRHVVSTYGTSLTHALGLQRGTHASSYTQLYSAFLISGLIHCCGDLLVSRALFGTSLPFFLANAVAITMEDAVIAVARRHGFGVPGSPSCWVGVWRAVGYVWVAVWFSVTAPRMLDIQMRPGTRGDVAQLPFSVVQAFAPRVVIRMMRATL